MCVGDSLCYDETTTITRYLNDPRNEGTPWGRESEEFHTLRLRRWDRLRPSHGQIRGTFAALRRRSLGSGCPRPHLCRYLRLAVQLGGQQALGGQTGLERQEQLYRSQLVRLVRRRSESRRDEVVWIVDVCNGPRCRAYGYVLEAFCICYRLGYSQVLTVPHDKPAEAFAMVSRWLKGKDM